MDLVVQVLPDSFVFDEKGTTCPKCDDKHIVDFMSTKTHYCRNCTHEWSWVIPKKPQKNLIQHTR